MKVLLISPTYSAGGAERCARELFLHLRTRGHHTTMWVAAVRPGDPPGVESIRFPGERYGYPLDLALHHTDWRHAGSRWRLGRLSRRDFDVVHFHNVHGNWLSLRAMHDLCERMPCVWTMHDEWAATGGLVYDLGRVLPPADVRRLSSPTRLMPYHVTPGVERLRRFLARWMPRPRAIIAPSPFLHDLLAASGRFTGVANHTIPNGLTLLDEPAIAQPRATARAALGISPARQVVLMVAADLSAAYKGAELGIEVLNRIDGAQRPVVVLLGKNAEPLAARLHGFDVVTKFAADAATLATAYRAADVTLVPSRGDNLPFIVLESFACRTPVAAFAVGGITQLLGDGRGSLAPAFDLDALRDRVLELLRDPVRAGELSERAFRWVAAECNMTTYLDRITAVYEAARG